MIRNAPWLRSLVLGSAIAWVHAPAAAQDRGADATGGAPQASDETAPKQRPSPLAAYVPGEGFRIRSESGDYVLRLSLLSGFKYEPVWTNGRPATNGLLAFVWPAVAGSIYKPWLRYAVAFELAAPTPFLVIANVDATPWDLFGVTVGQQVTPVSRHLSLNPTLIFFPDYAPAAGYFWSGRQKGATVHGSLERTLDYWVGLYGGAPLRETTSNPHAYIVEGRATVNPAGPVNATELPFMLDGTALPARVSFTVQGYHGTIQRSVENVAPTNSPLDTQQSFLLQTMSTIGADLWLQYDRLIVTGEYYRRYVDATATVPRTTAQGAWGQILANVYDRRIGVGARVNWIDPSSNLSNDDLIGAEGQVAWFIHAPELVLKLRYAWMHQRSPDPAALGAVPLPFAVGTTNLLTLQLNASF